MTDLLSVSEQSDLTRCEEVIKGGVRSFIEVGTALNEIRERKLYRAAYRTFDEYCRKRWDIGRNYAQKIMDSSRIVERDLSTRVHNSDSPSTMPVMEAQVRPLVSLPPEERLPAWTAAQEKAQASGRATASPSDVREEVDRRIRHFGMGTAPTTTTVETRRIREYVSVAADEALDGLASAWDCSRASALERCILERLSLACEAKSAVGTG